MQRPRQVVYEFTTARLMPEIQRIEVSLIWVGDVNYAMIFTRREGTNTFWTTTLHWGPHNVRDSVLVCLHTLGIEPHEVRISQVIHG